MTILVAGANGATGRQLVEQLLSRGEQVKVIVRSPEKFHEVIPPSDRLTVIKASILELTEAEMARHVNGCDAVASCLGHNITLKGVFGPPYRLVTDATRRLCQAIQAHSPEKPVKFVLMNTTGNRNRDLKEPVSLGQRSVIGLLRLLVPPQPDNEQAADYLRVNIGQNNKAVEWVAVRPDGLINEPKVTAYDVYPSPVRCPIFNPGKTSRINVGHFMADLITEKEVWKQWKGRMPVIYNCESKE